MTLLIAATRAEPHRTTVSQNLSLWVGNNTQWWIIFHSLLILKVNFSPSADVLKFVTAKTPPSKLYLPLKSPQFFSHQIHIHNFAPNFPLTLSFWGYNIPLDTQARLQFWDVVEPNSSAATTTIAIAIVIVIATAIAIAIVTATAASIRR